MATDLKSALSDVNLDDLMLDGLEDTSPQLLAAIENARNRIDEVIAHQNHGSHADHSTTSAGQDITFKRPENADS